MRHRHHDGLHGATDWYRGEMIGPMHWDDQSRLVVLANDGEPVDLDDQGPRFAPWCICDGGRCSAEWLTWGHGGITGYCCAYCRKPTQKTIPAR